MRTIMALLALILLGGCGSDGPGSNVVNLDCIMIAGDYNTPVELEGKKENMAISISSNCEFASSSPSTGDSYGKLHSVGNSTYQGTGKSPACGGGTFSVTVTGSNIYGISFSAQCN